MNIDEKGRLAANDLWDDKKLILTQSDKISLKKWQLFDASREGGRYTEQN